MTNEPFYELIEKQIHMLDTFLKTPKQIPNNLKNNQRFKFLTEDVQQCENLKSFLESNQNKICAIDMTPSHFYIDEIDNLLNKLTIITSQIHMRSSRYSHNIKCIHELYILTLKTMLFVEVVNCRIKYSFSKYKLGIEI
jgi:hypothetical protein